MNFKEIINNTFYQLLVLYTILIILISLNLFWKFTLHLEILALILAITGITLTNKSPKKEINGAPHLILFIIAVILILGFRTIPYLTNSIPLGYDTGIYKYAIDSFSQNNLNVEPWIKKSFTPGFLYLTFLLKKIFSSTTILTWIFILSNLALGISIYFVAKEYFNKTTAITALLLYAVSAIQFKVFTYMYYKNVIALSIFLCAIYFLKKENRIAFIITGALIGAFHRPTLLIFGLTFIQYTISNKKFILNLVSGMLILTLTAIFYTGFLNEGLLSLIPSVASSFTSFGEAPGTFISFFTYQFTTLAYLPFAIIGFIYLIKKKQFNMIFFWTLINTVIVYFQFLFFNRFIIHLDIALIILAALGFALLIENKKNLGIVVVVIMLLVSGFTTYIDAKNARPLIGEQELNLIKTLQNTESNSKVIAISSEYSPWVLAYSKRPTIAPGLFGEDKWDRSQWERFWTTDNETETITLLSIYDKPLYLFAGTKEFNNPCFSIYTEENQQRIYKYDC